MASMPALGRVRVVWRLLLVAGLGIGPAVPVGVTRTGGDLLIPAHRGQPAEPALVAPGSPLIQATKQDNLGHDANGNGFPHPRANTRPTARPHSNSHPD